MESHVQLSSGCGVGGVTRQLATDAVPSVSRQLATPSHSVTTAGIGTPWTLDQVKYLFLSVDD